MARISIIVAVAVFCLLNARTPDPRILAAIDALSSNHIHQIEDADGSFYCPMDPEVRSIRPGKCPRCGMTLVDGVPDIVEYPLDLTVAPNPPRAAEVTRLTFGITNPRTFRPVRLRMFGSTRGRRRLLLNTAGRKMVNFGVSSSSTGIM